MPFREKTAWISMVSMLAIYGYYFWSVMHDIRPVGGLHFGGLLQTVIALVVVQVVLTIAAAVVTPKEARAPCDEREKLIQMKAARFAYAGLATGIAVACLFGAFDPPVVFNANSLLFILVTSELARTACQIIHYRRGA
jgi:hypothetical protein